MYSDGGFESQISANMPNASMMMLAYSSTFGNINFMIQPSNKGSFQEGFVTIPYLSLEALLYNGQMSNQTVAPRQIQTGSTAGTQNLQGGTTVTDANGNIRVQIGTTGGF
jgi:hypothetical protein